MVEARNHAALCLAADEAIAGVEDRPPDVGLGRLDHWCAMIDAASHATVASTANMNKHAKTTRDVWVIALAAIRRSRATDSRSSLGTRRANPRASARAPQTSPTPALLVPASSDCRASKPPVRSIGRRSCPGFRAIPLSLQSLP